MKSLSRAVKKSIPKIVTIIIFLFIFIGVIVYARGYRINFSEKSLSSSGILSVNSSPKAAKIYIDGQLRGATDLNLTIPYGRYNIEVKKEGFTDWKKTVSLKGETVMSFDALLFPKNPSLTPLTSLGIVKAVPLGNTDKILLISESGNVEKDGVYLFESGNKPLIIFPPLKLLMLKSIFPEDINFQSASFEFDTNYQQGIVTFEKESGSISYLISLNENNLEIIDISPTKENIVKAWNIEKNKEMLKVAETLPKVLRPFVLDSFELISLSPDEKRLMYRAKNSVYLPLVLDPPIIGANQSPESRDIEAGGIYIYDKKEDKNFKLPIDFTFSEPTAPSPSPIPQVSNDKLTRKVQESILWYPTSDYVAIKEKNQIVLVQYDGENKQTVYAGPFDSSFFAISPDWNLMVLINLNPQNNKYGDLYSVGIR